MYRIGLDEKWTFRRGLLDSIGMLKADPGVEVDLPHDGMIHTAVTPDAPGKMDTGYFTGDVCNYTKFVFIPKEWEDECVGLLFDGAMMNATVDVNGYKAGAQHYGYAPFYVDLTKLVAFGEENRITINVNTSMQPNSRWYSGSGLYRGVKLLHGPKVHIVPDGIYTYTKEVADGYAFLETQVEVQNDCALNRLVELEVLVVSEDGEDTAPFAKTKRVIQVEANNRETARLAVTLENPKLWDVETPNLYRVKVRATDMGSFRTHFEKSATQTVDEASVLFGVRTITADAVRGLRINGKTVKLKGGCVHHDNGLLGAVSLYEAERRKVRKLKENGFNAIRTAHNPPSAVLLEACDREGMYVFNEAFDACGMAKRGGDYNQFFDADWEKDLTAFVKRDRTHPSVIIWSTGNEIPERGGLNNGYTLATRLANTIRLLDGSRPISNGICSFWSGLDDYLAEGQNQAQNANDDERKDMWEKGTEPFTNGLDIVGYNYMEDIYERDHELFPERVILGSENFPKEIGFRWPMIERLPYVIGDFTWTAWDYLGEAGIGKALYVDQDDPLVDKKPWEIMPQTTSPFPWRTAYDADFDITGRLLPQGAYRSVVWGNKQPFLYSYHPETYGKVERMSMWGFPEVLSDWNYEEYVGKPVELLVFSNAQEVELLVNGESIGKKAVNMDRPLPNSVCFETSYQPGKVEAISYVDGKESGRAVLQTTKKPVSIRLVPEKQQMKADGHDLIFVGIELVDEDGRIVPNATLPLTASLKGSAVLAGFGTGNPITTEDYTDNETTSYRGVAMAILRAGYEAGEVELTVSGDGLLAGTVELHCGA